MIGRKPDLVCIGASGAATHWLSQALQSRDDCWAPPFREVEFFSYKFLKDDRKAIRARVMRAIERAASQHRRNRTRKGASVDDVYLEYLTALTTMPPFNGTWYKQVFSRAPERMRCLDVTPDYSILPEDGIAFVAKFLPHARFICVLADPVTRASAQMRQIVAEGDTRPQSLDQWANLAQQVAADPRGDYARFVPRWQARFDSQHLLMLPQSDISADPKTTMRKLEAFANLDREDTWALDRGIAQETKIALPDEVAPLLAEQLASQTAFLRAHLGEAFLR